MMKALILLALAAVVAGRAMDDCATCKQVVAAVDAQLKSNATVEEIENTINKICDAIPGIGPECKQYVKQYVPEVVDMIAAQISAAQICKELHLCNNSFLSQFNGLDLPMGPGPVVLNPETMPGLEADRTVEQVQEPAGELCTICEFAISEIEKELKDNSTEAQVIAAVEKVCDILPSTVKAECKQLIETEGPQIINILINKGDPKAVCTLLQLCKAAMPVAVGVDQPAGELCTICEFAISTIEKELKDNATEAEIIATVEKVCDILPSTVKDECKQLIETEGPQIIALLISKGDPEAVCTLIKLCTNGSATVHHADDKPYCQTCEQVMTYVQALLKENSTTEEVEALIEKICDYLPGSLQSECKQVVEAYAPEIVAMLAGKVNPDQICAEVQLCSTAGFKHVLPVQRH